MSMGSDSPTRRTRTSVRGGATERTGFSRCGSRAVASSPVTVTEHRPASVSARDSSVPHTMGWKRLICLAKERWKTERAYADLKGDLGFAPFESRR